VEVLSTARRCLSESARVDEQERLEDELLELADRLDDPGGRARAALWRFETRLDEGRGEDLERILDLADVDVPALRAGSYHFTLAYGRAALALLRGSVEEADLLVERAAAIGRRRGLPDVIVEGVRLIQTMGVRHEQGRLGEIRDELQTLFSQAGVPEWLGAVAFVDGELGHLDRVGPNLDAFFSGFEARGARVSVGIGLLAHVAAPVARVGDTARAALLHEALLPHSGRGGHISYFTGPIDYALGLLARTLGREDEARAYFQQAAAFCERLGAPLWKERCERAGAEAAASGDALSAGSG